MSKLQWYNLPSWTVEMGKMLEAFQSCFMATISELSGINAVLYFSVFKSARRPSGLANGFIGIATLSGSVVAAALMDKVGRKVLLLCSFFGMAIAMAVQAVAASSYPSGSGSTYPFVGGADVCINICPSSGTSSRSSFTRNISWVHQGKGNGSLCQCIGSGMCTAMGLEMVTGKNPIKPDVDAFDGEQGRLIMWVIREKVLNGTCASEIEARMGDVIEPSFAGECDVTKMGIHKDQEHWRKIRDRRLCCVMIYLRNYCTEIKFF